MVAEGRVELPLPVPKTGALPLRDSAILLCISLGYPSRIELD